MTERPAHFTASDDGFLPTRFVQSHWGDDHLNGPAVVGLAARALELRYGSAEFMPARLTVDLFKAARGVPTTVVTHDRPVDVVAGDKNSAFVRAAMVAEST